MEKSLLDQISEEILKNKDIRVLSIKVGLALALSAFCLALLSLYLLEVDPWNTFWKSLVTALSTFFIGFYATLFSVIIRNKKDESEGERKTNRTAPAVGGEDSNQPKAETPQ